MEFKDLCEELYKVSRLDVGQEVLDEPYRAAKFLAGAPPRRSRE